MSKKNRINVVYSTNPNFNYDHEEDEQETLSPAEQKLLVRIERKHRGGKTVTLVDGFIGTDESREELARNLKSKCGVGGSAKEGEIIIQGELVQKVFDILLKMGYSRTKKGN
ncbi:MAG: translation initiation factor [Flavobacteriales bacterium]